MKKFTLQKQTSFIVSGAIAGIFILYGLLTKFSNSESEPVPASINQNKMGNMNSSMKMMGQYKDGEYVGPSEDAFYGFIQTKAIIQNGRLADVIFLQYPNDRPTSRSINQQAMPILKQEAIAVQSGQVDIVTGATDSSKAFIQSLTQALLQAQ